MNPAISAQDAFEICFRKTERHPLFRLSLQRKVEGVDEPLEEVLEDPHSELFVNVSGVVKITAVFRDDLLRPVYRGYIKALHDM